MNIDFSQVEGLDEFLTALEQQTGLTKHHLALMEPQMPPRFRDVDEILLERSLSSHQKDKTERLPQLVAAGILEYGKRRPDALRLTRDGQALLELFWAVRMVSSMADTLGGMGVTGVEFG